MNNEIIFTYIVELVALAEKKLVKLHETNSGFYIEQFHKGNQIIKKITEDQAQILIIRNHTL